MAAIRDFLMDANGDLAVVNGDFATVADAAAVPQGIKIRARFFLGEYFLDESIGIDFIGQIFVKNPDPVVVRELLREAIAETPDVTDVLGAALQLDTDRNGTITFTVATIYSASPVILSVEVSS